MYLVLDDFPVLFVFLFIPTTVALTRVCPSVRQDDHVLQVGHFRGPKRQNADAPVGSTFRLIVIKEEAETRDGPTIIHDESVFTSTLVQSWFDYQWSIMRVIV